MSSYDGLKGFTLPFSSNRFILEQSIFHKTNLIHQLSQCIKEINFDCCEHGRCNLQVCDTTSTLCSIIEGMFLHGLRDTVGGLKKSIANMFDVVRKEFDRRVHCNFWPTLLIISHKEIIELIQKLTQINTDVGCCRAWIRASLNEGFLAAYLTTIEQNISSFESYYHTWAFLRDGERLDVAAKLIESVELAVKFDLPVNSSLLNVWSDWALELAGISSMAVNSRTVSSGIDIVNEIQDVIPQPTQYAIAVGEEIGEEVEAENGEESNELASNNALDSICDSIVEEIPEESATPSMGNSIIFNQGWSSHESVESPVVEKTNFFRSTSYSSEKQNFSSLLENYEARHSQTKRPLKRYELWERFENSLGGNISSQQNSETSVEHLKYKVEELQKLVEQSCRLGLELGLDAQGFKCLTCENPLCIGLAKQQVCAFNGGYYCDNCMSPDQYSIPAKIIYNWDFKQYPVSIHAATFLTDFQQKPFIDLNLLNPAIYDSVTEMLEIHDIRIQLNFIATYIYTCREKVIEQFQESIESHEYYHENVYCYSIADLNAIQSRKLRSVFERGVAFGRAHIDKCKLCSQKGFICEICKSPQVLYPFDRATTHRCQCCGGIIHLSCYDKSRPCDKCDRRKRREDLPLLEIGE